MTKNKTPFFAFYPADFIMNTSRLSDEMVGKYIRLLCDQWVNGPLERDQIPQTLGKYYTEVSGGWVQERLEEERQKALKIWNQRKDASDAAALKRKKSPSDPSSGSPDGPPSDTPNQNQNQNHNKNYNKNKNLKQLETTKVVLPWPSEKFRKAWDLWLLYKKKEHGFKFKTTISQGAALAKLVNDTAGLSRYKIPQEDLAIATIFTNIAKTYKGLIPLKNDEIKKLLTKTDDNELDEIRRKYDI